MREKVHQTVGEDNRQAQVKQQCNYNRCHQVPKSIKVAQKVLLKNEEREGRKGGKFSFK